MTTTHRLEQVSLVSFFAGVATYLTAALLRDASTSFRLHLLWFTTPLLAAPLFVFLWRRTRARRVRRRKRALQGQA